MCPVNKTVPSELDRIDQEIQQARDEERHFRQQKKILAHQGKELERKARITASTSGAGCWKSFCGSPCC